MRFSIALALIALPGLAGAQTAGSILAPVSRTVTLVPDEAAFSITVAGTLDSTEQQVKAALQNAGLPNPTVVATGVSAGFSEYFVGPPQIAYSATVTVAAGSAMDAAKGLEALRTTLAVPLLSLQYSVGFNPSQATVDAQRQVVLPQLVDDARKLAQLLAAASGVKVGAIRSINDSVGSAVGSISTMVRNVITGDFSALALNAAPRPAAQSTPPAGVPYTYTMSVVFATAL